MPHGWAWGRVGLTWDWLGKTGLGVWGIACWEGLAWVGLGWAGSNRAGLGCLACVDCTNRMGWGGISCVMSACVDPSEALHSALSTLHLGACNSIPCTYCPLHLPPPTLAQRNSKPAYIPVCPCVLYPCRCGGGTHPFQGVPLPAVYRIWGHLCAAGTAGDAHHQMEAALS